jgi:hypothetical protein
MTIASLVNQLLGLINLVVPIIIGLTLVAFIWRAAMSIGTAGSANEKTKVKLHTFLLWGVGAIFIMVSIWGILNILSGIFFSAGGSSSPTSDPDYGTIDTSSYTNNLPPNEDYNTSPN